MPNYVEYNAVKAHAEEITALGRSALIVTGRHSARACGALDDVVSVLNGAGIRFIVFDRVEENPSIETVMASRDEGVAAGAEFVIGIGGGSPMDAAKAIAVMIKNADAGWELLYETAQAGGVPVVCVPTTCGTGSEVTAVAVLTRHDMKTKVTAKQKLFPVLSLVDPSYLEKAGHSIIRNTSIDAMGHMIESYINNNATQESRGYVLEGLKIWGSVKQYLETGVPDDPAEGAEVLMKLAKAANFGGYAIVTPGTSLPHGMSYQLTYEKHVPHGMAIGIFEPGYMDFACERDREVLLEAMGFDTFEEFRAFIGRVCIEPMFEGYLSVEEFKETAYRSAEGFILERSRMDKIPYKMDIGILHRIIDDIITN